MGCSWAIAVALWWLLPAALAWQGVARVGLVGVPFPCGAGRTFVSVWRVEAWQTAALNAYKKPLLRPEIALQPLLWPCGGFCVREWRVLGLLGYLFLRSWADFWRVWRVWGLAQRQTWTPIRSQCCGRGVPLSHCCGLVVAFACGRGACWACWGTVSLRSWANFWRSWKAWRVWGLANGSLERLEKKPLLRPWGALEPLLWPCGGFCLQPLGVARVQEMTGSTPPVVPGAAPALAKAGVGGFTHGNACIHPSIHSNLIQSNPLQSNLFNY